MQKWKWYFNAVKSNTCTLIAKCGRAVKHLVSHNMLNFNAEKLFPRDLALKENFLSWLDVWCRATAWQCYDEHYTSVYLKTLSRTWIIKRNNNLVSDMLTHTFIAQFAWIKCWICSFVSTVQCSLHPYTSVHYTCKQAFYWERTTATNTRYNTAKVFKFYNIRWYT